MVSSGKQIKSAEIIIVNDGSKDRTMDLALNYTKEQANVANLHVRALDLVFN